MNGKINRSIKENLEMIVAKDMGNFTVSKIRERYKN